MDWTNIITAAVTGGFAVLGQWLISRRKAAEDETKDAVREQKQADRLDAIEHKLDIHNGYAEKFGAIEKSITSLDKSVALIQQDVQHFKERNGK